MKRPIVFRLLASQGRVGWLAILTALLLFAAVTVAFTIIAVGAFVILAPIALIAIAMSYGVPTRWLWGKRTRAPKPPTIIDGDFRVLDASEIELKPHSSAGPLRSL